MSIEISHLTKRYGTQTVLQDVNLRVGAGQVAGFLGPNGAGKTTTMRIVAGAVSYHAGSVRVCGMEVKKHRLQANALVGYLPEQNPLYVDMYVREYLRFVADTYRLGRAGRKRVDELIEQVGLTPECHKKIAQLSKGYRQRVGLAQALVPDPKVLILDEPTTGLDPNQLEEIRALIRRVGRERTVLLSTHILQEVSAICNCVIIINRGRIVGHYDSPTLLPTARGEMRRVEVEFALPLGRERLLRIDGIHIEKEHQGRRFLLASEGDIRGQLFDMAVENHNKLLLLKEVENTIEDIFRELTQ